MLFSSNFIELDVIDSTNNYALHALKQNKVQHGTCIFAHNQTAGKGQMGKQWLANASKNITISVILDINDDIFNNPFSIMAFSGVVCSLFVKNKIQACTRVKWPNDIYINDKKAGGILIETSKSNNKRFAIIGIGLNVNEDNFPKELKNAISLKQITGENYDIVPLTKIFWTDIINYFEEWKKLSLNQMVEEYNNLLFKKNEEVKLKKQNIIFTGIVKGVNKYGELELNNSIYDTCSFGTVEWLINEKK